ncbi:MAG: T9SS type A sorting domain-containing protein [Candidatus Eisenbacteria bacterium]
MLNRLSLLLGVLVLVFIPSACFSIWHCGDIELPAEPRSVLIDPVTGDFFVGAATAHLMRIDEASYDVTLFDLVDTPDAIGLDPASRLLYICHADAGMVTIMSIETGDTVLVEVGESPSGVALDPIRGLVYVAAAGDSAIWVLENSAVIDTILCDGSPTAVAVDPWTGRGFATLTDSDLLFDFDTSTGDTAYFTTGLAPAGIEIDPEKGELYIANSGEAAITVFVIESDSVYSVSVDGPVTALALNPETGHLFAGTVPAGVTIVDTDTYATQNVGLPAEPAFISIDGLADRAFASLPGADLLVEIDSDGDTLMIPVPGNPAMLALNPVTYKCYVADTESQALSVFEAGNYSGERISAMGGPGQVLINLGNHKVYSPKWFSGGLVVIDGYTDQVSSIPTADGPNGLRVDPVSDDIYVVCAWAGMLTVKRSDSPDTLLVPIGGYAHGLGLNPNTGKAYVSNRYTRDLSVIDMETLDTTMVRTGAYPCYVDINLDHNKIYVPNRTSWSLTVVDGALLTTTFVPIGRAPTLVCVQPVTNKILSADSGGRTITVVDGTTLEREEIPVGTTPRGMAINTNTNTIYVASGVDGEVTVLDGDTYSRTPVPCEVGIFAVKMDKWLDRAFTAGWSYDAIYLIDGNFFSRLRIPTGAEPHGIAYDPVLEKLYVANHAGNSMDIIKVREKISPRLEVTIDSLPGDVAYTPTPTITGTATSLRAPRDYGIMKVLYKVDNLRGAWSEATVIGHGTAVTWEITTPPQLLGEHLVFVAALDSTAGSLSSSSISSLVRMSDIACYEFTCLTSPPETPVPIAPPDDDQMGGDRLAWTPTCGSEGWYDIELSADPDFSGDLTRISSIQSPVYTLTPGDIDDGVTCWRVAAVDYPHGKRSAFSPVYTLDLADGPGGPTGPALAHIALTIFPNPASQSVSLRLAGTNPAGSHCAVYDVAGRFVAAIPLVASDNGLAGSWSATDVWGNPLPQGVYYARIKAGRETFEHKIILLR